MYSWDRLSDQGLVCILLHLFPSVVGWLTSEAGRKKGSIQQLKDLKTSNEAKYCVTRVHIRWISVDIQLTHGLQRKHGDKV